MSPLAVGPAWAEWATATFLRAHRLGRPILLLLTTRWTTGAAALVDGLLGAAPVARLVDERFIAIRVDADERPDIAERYTVHGWPTLAFLTPAGLPLGLWPGDEVDAGRLASTLDAVSQRYARERPVLDRAIPAAALGAQPSPATRGALPDADATAAMTAMLVGGFDRIHGGFGAGPKFPHASALEFALVETARGAPTPLADIALASLDAMAEGGLRDRHHGGFHRACAGHDWSAPDTAVLLDVQADMLRLYSDAALVLGATRYRDVAAELSAFVRREMPLPMPGFRLAWSAAARDRPADLLCFVGANARIASALIKAGVALDDGSLVELAVEVLERVVSEAYRPGAGLARVLDPRPRLRGLVDDQVAVSAALLEAAAATGRVAYADLAEEVMRSTMRRFWHADLGALGDRVPTTAGAGDVGLLAMPFAPLAANCQAGSVLLALADRSQDTSLATLAVTILASFALVWREAGLEGAPYALACGDLRSATAEGVAGPLW